ncbi:MAG: hypothetical protein ACYTBV_16460 [Planctomycetota bacterium]|jgi:hypothetical protein
MYIDESYKKKYSPDKVVLLGLLILGVLLAQWLVVARRAITLGDPIILKSIGLSASLPGGQGWECDTKWRSFNQVYTLNAYYDTSGQRVLFHPQVQIQLKYTINKYNTDAPTRFQKKESVSNGLIMDTGQINTSDITLEWVHIFQSQKNINIFFGTVFLPDNYLLDIEVMETIGDLDFAKRVFETIAENIHLNNPY